jgi:hypothetical protein
MEKTHISNTAKSHISIQMNTAASGKIFAMGSFMDLKSLSKGSKIALLPENRIQPFRNKRAF